MAQFKLLAGLHVQGDPDKPLKGDDGKPIPGKFADKVHNAGEIVESDDDLVDKYGHQKFQLVGGQPRKISRTPGDKAPGLNPVANPGGQVESGFQEATTYPGDSDYPVDTVGPASRVASEETRKRLETAEAERNAQQKPAESSPTKAAGGAQGMQQQTANASKATPQQLDRMSQKELTEYAEEREIDLKGAKGRDDILKVLKSSK